MNRHGNQRPRPQKCLRASLFLRNVVIPSRSAGHAVRLGVDSAVGEDGARLADAVAADLVRRGLPVARVRQQGFLRPRSIRLEYGSAAA